MAMLSRFKYFYLFINKLRGFKPNIRGSFYPCSLFPLPAPKGLGNNLYNYMESKNSELFVNLSKHEQETITGGRHRRHSSSQSQGLDSLFFHLTHISTSGSNAVNISNDGISSLQQSAYESTQITLGINSSSGGYGHNRHGSRNSSYENLLSWLLMALS
ncbi:MAG: hypothetical protein PUP92_10310 [Rhizonema sp. PD38]|nr:hypothetical protein [Rhizonema sp. PD38]